MSRHGYSDEYGSEWDLIRWRGAVLSAMRGRRGRAFLKEAVEAVERTPSHRLGSQTGIDQHGDACTLACVLRDRGMPREQIEHLDWEDPETLAETLGIAPALTREILYENDEFYGFELGARPDRSDVEARVRDRARGRYDYMLRWLRSQLSRVEGEEVTP